MTKTFEDLNERKIGGDVDGNLGEEVSRVESTRRFGNLFSVFVHVFLACLFVLAGVGAIVYSVNHSEEIAKAEGSSSKDKGKTTKKPFNFFTDQTAWTGVLTTEYRMPLPKEGNGSSTEIMVSKIGTSWVQDNGHRRLVHRVGLTDADWRFTLYVYNNYSISVTNKCERLPTLNYTSFLAGFGFAELKKVRREEVVLEPDGQHRQKSTSVDLYQGEVTSSNASIYGKLLTNDATRVEAPYLASVFTREDADTVYGWQIHFQPSDDGAEDGASGILWAEFWYPKMAEGAVPDAAVFFEYPEHCLKA